MAAIVLDPAWLQLHVTLSVSNAALCTDAYLSFVMVGMSA